MRRREFIAEQNKLNQVIEQLISISTQMGTIANNPTTLGRPHKARSRLTNTYRAAWCIKLRRSIQALQDQHARVCGEQKP